MSKNNVHPDHYKTAGRDRQDDAAAARQARAMAKTSSRERPDRMGKAFYFERPEPARPASAGRPEDRAQKDSAPRRTVRASKAGSTPRKTGRTAKPGTKKK